MQNTFWPILSCTLTAIVSFFVYLSNWENHLDATVSSLRQIIEAKIDQYPICRGPKYVKLNTSPETRMKSVESMLKEKKRTIMLPLCFPCFQTRSTWNMILTSTTPFHGIISSPPDRWLLNCPRSSSPVYEEGKSYSAKKIQKSQVREWSHAFKLTCLISTGALDFEFPRHLLFRTFGLLLGRTTTSLTRMYSPCGWSSQFR